MACSSGGQIDAPGSEQSERNSETQIVTDSWATITSRCVNKNVLEVILEKDVRGSFSVSDIECARFLSKLGLDLRPGCEIESVQICPNGRGVLYITLKESVDISRYCRYDVIEVSESGIRSVLVKPAGKRDVIINIRGIHPNTRDELVQHYLEKFGKLVTKKVIYGVYSDGPLRGIKNGDRSYKLEIKPGSNLGSYHLIDGQRVNIRYSGQQQTCARCLETAMNCKGRGVARRCETEGGIKKDFRIYIANLWNSISYSPPDSELNSTECDDDDFEIQVGGQFTPLKCT